MKGPRPWRAHFAIARCNPAFGQRTNSVAVGRHPRRIARRIAAYAWAGPNTLLGLFAGLVVLACGGRLRVGRGALEFFGGWLSALTSSPPPAFAFRAITFGHVILGVSAADLEAVREHEHVHVAQYEAWGPLFLLAYAASSVWQVLHGRRAYRDNFFERQAYAAQAEAKATA